MEYDVQNIYDFIDKKVCCKGFRVPMGVIYNTFKPIYTDYWGGNTKDILNVSRDSLSHKQLEQNKSIFEESAVCLAKIYYEVLESLIKSDKLKKLCAGYEYIIYTNPLMSVIHLMLWGGVDISQLEENIRKSLSSLSGYNNAYGFEDKKDFGDIIFSDELKITYDNYNDMYVEEFLFFLEERKINKITVNSDKKILIVYDKEYNKRDTVVYGGDAFAVFLNNYYRVVPVPFGFENIAVRGMAGDQIFEDSGTYMTYLWDYFSKIKKSYTGRIKNGEDIEKLADEIVPESRTDKKPATNVLRNICYDRASEKIRKLPYDEAWHKVRDTYRKFVIKVLNAVKWLLENGYIELTDDNNEEMENNEL